MKAAISLLMCLWVAVAGAQTIVGKVTDKKNKEAVPYANIFLFNKGDFSKAINGATAEEDGSFTIQNVKQGSYLLRIQMVGYKELQKEVEVASEKVDLGELAMLSDNSDIIEKIEVVAEKPLVQTDIGVRSYNVSQDLVNKGGTALDVLQNIPSVQVDENNNVTLRGVSNFMVFINGKQSGLAGSNPQSIFQRIPASSIERIEIINNPSAKYDAESSGGIINIVLKKQQEDGFGGNAGFNYGNFGRYNGNFDVNLKKGKWNVYASLNGNRDTRLNSASIFRKNFIPNTTPIIDQQRSIERIGENYTGSLGIEFTPTAKDNLSLEANWGGGRANRTEILNNFNRDFDNTLLNTFVRNSDEMENSFNQNYAFNYQRKLAKPKQELKVSSSLGLSQSNTNLGALQTGDVRQKTTEDNSNQVWLLQVDYSHPLNSEGWKVETGYKNVFRNVQNSFVLEDFDNTSSLWLNNTNFSNNFRFDEKVLGAYAILYGTIKKLEFEAGLRVEQTFTTSELLNTGQVFRNDYLNTFPNAALSYRLPHEQQLRLMASRRINRPGFRQLNPFASFSNPLTLRSGNPFLRPEYTNSFELGYLKDWKQASFTGSAFYRRTTNVIQPFIRQLAGDTTLFAPANIATAENYGLELIGSYRVGKWLTLNADASFFRTFVNARNLDGESLNDVFSWNTRLNAIFNLPQNWRIQGMIMYRAPVATAQGTRKDLLMNSVGVSKQLWNNRATFTFRVSDIAKSMRFGGTVNTPNLFNDFTFTGNTRTYMFGFSYRFGGEMKERRNRQRREMQNGEMDGGEF